MKRRSRAPLILRFAGRLAAASVALVMFVLVAVQFARVIDQNLALARDLSTTQTEVSNLQARRRWQLQELRRLEDPEGAIPEIHERLRLVRPNEAIIFVSPAPSPDASAAP